MNGRIRNCFKDEATPFHLKATLAVVAAMFVAGSAGGEEAQWIWSPDHTKANVPTGEACHFRKVINLRAPEGGQISIAADDQYELFINGRRVGVGEATKKLDEYDISKNL